MKKLLGILLTTIMLCTSMGVLGANDYVWSNSLETYEVNSGMPTAFMYGSSAKNVSISVVNTKDEGLATVQGLGDKCLKIVGNTGATGTYYTRNKEANGIPKLEANTTYKYSFWWYPVGTSGDVAIQFGLYSIGGAKIRSLGQYYGVPNGKCNQWNYYEIYFHTKDVFTEDEEYRPYVEMKPVAGRTEYYDMFAFEKVEGVSISFFDGSNGVGKSNVSKMTATDRYVAQTNHQIENQYPSIYAVAANGVPVSEAKGKINIVTHYIPNKLTDKNILVAGIYQKEGDNEKLRQVLIKTNDYKAEGDSLKYDSNIRDLSVDMTNYPGCYIKAFVLSDFNAMKPISTIATLPAAQ